MFENSYVYLWLRFFTTFQHVVKVLQTYISPFAKFVFLGSLTREEGEAFFRNWKDWPCLLGKMPRLRVTIGTFFIENAVLGVPRWKEAPYFSPYMFCLFVAAEIFLQVAIFLEAYSVLKNAWSTTMVGWQRKRLVFWPAKTFTLPLISYSQISYFKAYFLFTWHLKFSYTDLLQFKYKCTYLCVTSLKNKQYTRQG